MAMPFLLNLRQIPSDLLQLFLAGDVIGGRFGTLLAAMHTVAFALLGAYAMAPKDEELADLVNLWLELKRNDGTIERLEQHWIEGRALDTKEPRWSVLRNVLGWVE